MAQDKVLNLPLSSDEIIEIILQRVEKRLRADCFLAQAMTYNGFSFDFEGKIKFNDMMLGRETLVWDKVRAGDAPEFNPNEQVIGVIEHYQSGDSPNKARVEHDLGIPVETQEGKRKVIRHKKLKPGETAA